MKTVTPYLKALKAFETAARYQSFSQAAAELFVTPAAVGQLVKQLERQLDVTLFERQAGGRERLVLTQAAKNALPDVQTGFEYLRKGLTALTQNTDDRLLTLTLSPALAGKWLLPRLEHFYARNPAISVRLHTDARSLDFAELGIDLGIRYGRGSWAGLEAVKLMQETVFPVCSPAILDRFENNPSGLEQVTLIHDTSMTAETGFITWQDWFHHAGIAAAPTAGLQINNSAAVLQAAQEGQGVALARSVMAADDLAAGRLVRLYPEIQCLAALAYYLVYPKQNAGQSKIRCFRDWILAEVKNSDM